MDSLKKKINAAIVLLTLLAASSAGLAYQVYADNRAAAAPHHMTYEEAVRATEKDCYK